MPTLNEYLGGLFASISRARASADIQTAQIAEQYARHDLLRHFSVPRMRISDIELTIPVALDKFATGRDLQLEPIGNERFRALVHRELALPLGLSDLPPAASQSLDARLDVHIADLAERLYRGERDDAYANFARIVADDFSQVVATHRLKPRTRVDYHALAERLTSMAPGLIRGVADKRSIDQLEVVAESHRLRELRVDDLIHIKMVVREEGMEWHAIDHADGSFERKLLPE